MFEFSIKKCSKKLAQLYVSKKNIKKKYETLLSKSGCTDCSNYNNGSVDRFLDRFLGCVNCKKLEQMQKVSIELDSIIEEIDDYIENEYALKVYEHYAKKQPDLIRISSGKTESWLEAFGDDFNKISKGLRHSLVGLVEENLRYKFK